MSKTNRDISEQREWVLDQLDALAESSAVAPDAWREVHRLMTMHGTREREPHTRGPQMSKLSELRDAEYVAHETSVAMADPPSAVKLLRSLYHALYPWGDAWPAPDTDVYVRYRGDVHESTVLEEKVEVAVDEWAWRKTVYLSMWDVAFTEGSRDKDVDEMKFCYRWTPEVP